mmetsp:Transcript_120943/g.226178  ORF Transcript_120943/g.226178 Transcript_120943/m.226178 type:complete len:267 (-) Transcript_120943:669-1469(-)
MTCGSEYNVGCRFSILVYSRASPLLPRGLPRGFCRLDDGVVLLWLLLPEKLLFPERFEPLLVSSCLSSPVPADADCMSQFLVSSASSSRSVNSSFSEGSVRSTPAPSSGGGGCSSFTSLPFSDLYFATMARKSLKRTQPVYSSSKSTHSSFLSRVDIWSLCIKVSNRCHVTSPAGASPSSPLQVKLKRSCSVLNSLRIRSAHSGQEMEGSNFSVFFSDDTRLAIQCGCFAIKSSITCFGKIEQIQYVLAMTQLVRGWPVSKATSPK